MQETSPADGKLTFPGDGSFVYTPNTDFTGTDSFTYLVNDGQENSDTVTVTLNVVAPSGSQKWYLYSNGDYLMEKTGTPTSFVPIANNNSDATWLSDQSATTDVTFPSGAWTINLKTPIDWSSTCSAQVGDYNTGTSTFTAFNGTKATGTYSNGAITITITTGGTVSAGDYLALRVFNSSSSTPYTVVTDGNSWLSSPATDPGYPLPEMSALILLGIGLAGLGGYILVRRKKEARGHIGQ